VPWRGSSTLHHPRHRCCKLLSTDHDRARSYIPGLCVVAESQQAMLWDFFATWMAMPRRCLSPDMTRADTRQTRVRRGPPRGKLGFLPSAYPRAQPCLLSWFSCAVAQSPTGTSFTAFHVSLHPFTPADTPPISYRATLTDACAVALTLNLGILTNTILSPTGIQKARRFLDRSAHNGA
jgi:hypothetical protein